MSDPVIDKQLLRRRMRAVRRAFEEELEGSARTLAFLRPPQRIAALAPPGSAVSLYHAAGAEAPTHAYARWFFENGHRIAVPWFASRDAAMEQRVWDDPRDETLLEEGPFGLLQPRAGAAPVHPALVFVPLLAFTADGHRLGQGAGHYDRWCAAHPLVPAVGLAWDCQLLDSLPVEPHDQRLDAIITPTRLYEAR